jgi:hypothetical protein
MDVGNFHLHSNVSCIKWPAGQVRIEPAKCVSNNNEHLDLIEASRAISRMGIQVIACCGNAWPRLLMSTDRSNPTDVSKELEPAHDDSLC